MNFQRLQLGRGLTASAAGDILQNMKEIDVTSEYFVQANPGIGALTYDAGYKRGLHKDEIAVAEWLHTTFGGDIHVFNERGYLNVSPDYKWNEKLWELKNPSTATSTDNAVKKAIKQIFESPGGIILDYGGQQIPEEVWNVIKRRIERSALSAVDVMFLQNCRLLKILRYKK